MRVGELTDTVGAFVPGARVALPATDPDGPLSGLEFAVKDVFDIPGSVTGFGQPTWRAWHTEATRAAHAVRVLLDAGAALVGKTVCDELCYSLTGENVHYGTPRNVNAPGRVPGGSSSGSAAAVAAGLVDFALGTDCGGSVRIPASYCGNYGLRPSHGRVSVDGVLPFAPPFDVVGWFARDSHVFAEVSRVMLADTLGQDPATPLRRLLMPADAWGSVDGLVAEALTDVRTAVEEGFQDCVPVRLGTDGLGTWATTFRVLQAAAIWDTLGEWVSAAQPRFGPGIAQRFAAAADVDADAVTAAVQIRARVTARIGELLGDDGVLCLPTSPHVAPRVGTPPDEVEVAARARAMELLCIAGLCGLPQVSIPGATLAGAPIGISLIGPRGSDLALVAHAVRARTSLPTKGWQA